MEKMPFCPICGRNDSWEDINNVMVCHCHASIFYSKNKIWVMCGNCMEEKLNDEFSDKLSRQLDRLTV